MRISCFLCFAELQRMVVQEHQRRTNAKESTTLMARMQRRRLEQNLKSEKAALKMQELQHSADLLQGSPSAVPALMMSPNSVGAPMLMMSPSASTPLKLELMLSPSAAFASPKSFASPSSVVSPSVLASPSSPAPVAALPAAASPIEKSMDDLKESLPEVAAAAMLRVLTIAERKEIAEMDNLVSQISTAHVSEEELEEFETFYASFGLKFDSSKLGSAIENGE